MATTSQQQLVCDSSTLANFKQWAQAISGCFTLFGWTQSSDTGQVNWSSISSVPGTNAYVYEIWQPNDGLTNFYLKMEYGNSNAANSPTVRLTVSASTNGSGTPTGFSIGPIATIAGLASITPPSTSTQYECDFSGGPGRFGALLWRNSPSGSNAQQLFAVERSLNASGAYTGTHVTVYVAGTSFNVGRGYSQRSLVLAAGAAPDSPVNTSNIGGWWCRFYQGPNSNTSNSGVFNNAIPFDTPAPLVGFYDFPATVVGVGCAGDFAEGVTFTVTLYGATRTYIPTKNGALQYHPYNTATASGALCLRFD